LENGRLEIFRRETIPIDEPAVAVRADLPNWSVALIEIEPL
jgi:hypothetical protein